MLLFRTCDSNNLIVTIWISVSLGTIVTLSSLIQSSFLLLSKNMFQIPQTLLLSLMFHSPFLLLFLKVIQFAVLLLLNSMFQFPFMLPSIALVQFAVVLLLVSLFNANSESEFHEHDSGWQWRKAWAASLYNVIHKQLHDNERGKS